MLLTCPFPQPIPSQGVLRPLTGFLNVTRPVDCLLRNPTAELTQHQTPRTSGHASLAPDNPSVSTGGRTAPGTCRLLSAPVPSPGTCPGLTSKLPDPTEQCPGRMHAGALLSQEPGEEDLAGRQRNPDSHRLCISYQCSRQWRPAGPSFPSGAGPAWSAGPPSASAAPLPWSAAAWHLLRPGSCHICTGQCLKHKQQWETG